MESILPSDLHYLPASLKRCFEYLAVFPPDYEFGLDEVVYLWIADGLVEEVEGRRVEDIGNEYYNELKARSIIQKSFRGNYIMHDIIQHLATVVSRKFCYKENSKENPASVRHAFLVNRNSMHYEFHQNYSLGESSICHLTHLRYLKIDALDSSHLLDSVCMLDNLKFLFLHEMHLEQLPEDIENLRSLRALDLPWSSILSLPESICSLCELEVLELKYCEELKELPKDIGNLRSLRTLDLQDTSISSLPESICSLCQLEVLDLKYREELKELPKDIGNLRSLRTLDFKCTSISSLPKSICSLCDLQVLNLDQCKELKELPKDIGNLRSLQTLYLRGTSILSMPESILNVTGLKVLFVSEYIQLPLHIGRLEGLVRLPLYHVEKEEGRRLGELSFMNRLIGELTVASMENIGGVEEAEMADLKSKKNVTEPEFRWSQAGNDEEMEVKIMEALQPYHALKSLTFSNYAGTSFQLGSWQAIFV